MARHGAALMVLGAFLLLLSLATFSYSRFVEWQHAAASSAVAPPTENLPSRLEVPSVTARLP